MPQTTFVNGINPFLIGGVAAIQTPKPVTGVRGPATVEALTRLLEKNEPLTCKQICALLRITTRNARNLLGQLDEAGKLNRHHHNAENGNYAYFTYSLRSLK